MSESTDRPYGYDEVIYPSRAVAYTHPYRMATLAHLLGLEPAPVERARVLELGTGTGGNLIPMAAQLPEAQFVGVDLSEAQVAQGCALIETLGLDNIELRHADVRELGPELGAFDYIICHGVYSWVPRDVQERLLSLCQAHLAPRGLAAVSYNVLPGWQVRDAYHQLLHLNDDPSLPADERIAAAVQTLRRMLAFIKPRKDPRSLWLSAELARFNQMDSSYFFHEYLSPYNEPLYFMDFNARVEAAGLRFVGQLHDHANRDGLFAPGSELPDEGALLRALAERDILRWRRFHCTMVGLPSLRPQRVVTPERLFELSIAMRLDGNDVTVDMDVDGPMTLIDADQGAHILRHGLELVARALMDAAPGAIPFHALPELLPAEGEGGVPWTPVALAERLLELVFAGVAQVHYHAPAVAKELSARPKVHRLTSEEAKRDEWVTNVWHDRIKLGPLQRVLLQFVDGTRTLAELREHIAVQVELGELSLNPPDTPIENVLRELQPALEDLGRFGILVA